MEKVSVKNLWSVVLRIKISYLNILGTNSPASQVVLTVNQDDKTRS